MYNIAFKYSFTEINNSVVWLSKTSNKRIFLEEIATGIGITAAPQPWPASTLARQMCTNPQNHVFCPIYELSSYESRNLPLVQ